MDSIANVTFFSITEVNPANSPIKRLKRYTKFFSEMCLYLQRSSPLITDRLIEIKATKKSCVSQDFS